MWIVSGQKTSAGATWSHALCPVVFPAGLSSAEYQQSGKASFVSVNWTLGDAQLEAVNTATGRRRDSGTPSRLCKHALFTRWSRLYRKVRADDHGGGGSPSGAD